MNIVPPVISPDLREKQRRFGEFVRQDAMTRKEQIRRIVEDTGNCSGRIFDCRSIQGQREYLCNIIY